MPTSIGDKIRVAFVQKWESVDDNINVMHFGVATNPTPNTDAALLEDLGELLGLAWTNIEAGLSTSLTADHIEAYNVSDDVPIGLGSIGGGYTGGTGTGEALPPADCLLLLMNTSKKRTQGRIYLSGLTEAQQSGGKWSSGMRSAAATLVADLMSTPVLPNGSEFQFGVYSRADGLLWQITTVRAQELTAYQKRRKPGRGS